MSDTQSLIKMLQSDNPNKRYDACEELRVSRQPLPQEAIDTLNSATNDPNPEVADAAQRALMLHTQMNNDNKEQDKAINNQESINKSQPTTPPKVNLGTAIGIGLLVGFIGTAFIMNLMTFGYDIMFGLQQGAIGSIFGLIGSVTGYGLTKSIRGVWIGAIIGTVVIPGCWLFAWIGTGGMF